jgi:hypothetical protein
VRSNLFDRAVDQMWMEAGHYYLFGYDAPILDHKPHTIGVHVRIPGACVRARHDRG